MGLSTRPCSDAGGAKAVRGFRGFRGQFQATRGNCQVVTFVSAQRTRSERTHDTLRIAAGTNPLNPSNPYPGDQASYSREAAR
jgi:hypothetical protein